VTGEASPLAAFLRLAAARPVVWGQWDCHLWLADWVQAVRGCEDPAAGYRGRYATPLGAKRLLKREGGSFALMSRLAGRAELVLAWAAEPGSEGRATDLRAGDIGLLPSLDPKGAVELIGAVFTGARWVALGWPAGIVAHPFTPLYVWRV
jgi:hypothetical protein